VNVVDSSGWLAYFANGRNADFFAQPLADVAGLIVPAVSVFEVFKRVLQQRGEAAALQASALMQQGRVEVMDASLAMVAARLSHELKLPMADSIMLATARRFEAELWTQDADFAGLPGVRYLAKAAAD
jgi:predicted nucleic acid-binding protein